MKKKIFLDEKIFSLLIFMSCHDKRFNFLAYLFMYARNLVFMFRQKRKLRFFFTHHKTDIFYFFTICRALVYMIIFIHDDDDDDCDFDIEGICFSLIIKTLRSCCFCSYKVHKIYASFFLLKCWDQGRSR